MSWLPSNDPVLGDRNRATRSNWSSCRGSATSARLRGAPRAAARQAPDGRALHLLRSFRAGAVHGRQGHGRAAAPAYRARHRHLSVRRQHHAPRQRGQYPGNPARRHEPDDGGPRHRPFRANAGRAAPRRRQTMLGLQSWIALPAAPRRSRRRFSTTRAADLPTVDDGGFTARVIAGSPLRRHARRSTMVSPWFYVEVALKAGHSRAARSPTTRSARSM